MHIIKSVSILRYSISWFLVCFQEHTIIMNGPFSSPVLRAGSQDLRLARQVIVTEGILLSPVMQDEAERSLYLLL